MSVEFNEEQGFGARRNFGTQKTPKLAEWLISKGVAKDVAGANRIQIIVSLIFFGIALFLFLR